MVAATIRPPTTLVLCSQEDSPRAALICSCRMSILSTQLIFQRVAGPCYVDYLKASVMLYFES